MLNDYLNDKPIKCFYDISFNKTIHDINNNKSGVNYVQNESRSFKIGDILPTKSSYYYYPDNFYIYDYTSDEHILHIIEDNIYKGYKTVDDIEIDYDNSYIVNMNGLEILDIKSKSDFYDISKHWEYCKKEHEELNKKYFPRGILNTFMTNINTFNKVKPIFDKELENVLEEFKIIWLKEDKYFIEKKFGVLVESIKNLYWELKSDKDLSDEERLDSLSLAYEEFDSFNKLYSDAKEKYLKVFKSIKEVHINNIISMVEKFMESVN